MLPHITGLCAKPWTNNIQKNIRGLRHSGQQAGLHQIRGLGERLTTGTLLTLSCQLHIISFNIIWTLFCCQKCVEISETEGLAARSNSCTKSNVMLSTQNWSPLAWGNLPATHRVRDSHPSGTCGNSQHSGSTSLKTKQAYTILNHHSTMVLLISRICFLDQEKWRSSPNPILSFFLYTFAICFPPVEIQRWQPRQHLNSGEGDSKMLFIFVWAQAKEQQRDHFGIWEEVHRNAEVSPPRLSF